MGKKNPYDSVLILSVSALIAIGIIMVFSSSFSYALVNYNDGYHFLKRILAWTVVGSFAMIFSARVPYWFWKRFAKLILIVSILLLVAVLTPLGKNLNGAQRWIGVGQLTVMPSEVAKFAVIIYLAASIDQKKEKMQTFAYGTLPNLLLIGLFFGLIYLQPDFSTAFVVAVVMMAIVFVGIL
jgi:cell division protein FtsW